MTREYIIANRKQLYTRENDAGNGFAIGNGDDHVNHCGSEGMALISASHGAGDPAVYFRSAACIIVGDAHGPWAVTIATTPRLGEAEALDQNYREYQRGIPAWARGPG